MKLLLRLKDFRFQRYESGTWTGQRARHQQTESSRPSTLAICHDGSHLVLAKRRRWCCRLLKGRLPHRYHQPDTLTRPEPTATATDRVPSHRGGGAGTRQCVRAQSRSFSSDDALESVAVKRGTAL
ncbi:hypothetical protein EYF80_035669 [Liparis tanakae]|uniref:Uncharacterized protein n=1 Tax=Liparis tanakae TaxID=230148 RepID=A0A4Z2GLL0_9TELE|nr:hypothetical protein EYF80_035669 [Liparis tanakae]